MSELLGGLSAVFVVLGTTHFGRSFWSTRGDYRSDNLGRLDNLRRLLRGRLNVGLRLVSGCLLNRLRRLDWLLRLHRLLHSHDCDGLHWLGLRPWLVRGCHPSGNPLGLH